MKTVSFDRLVELSRYEVDDRYHGTETRDWRDLLKGKSKSEWSAMDILSLEGPNDTAKLKVVLREELIEPLVLHEFMCRCAEYALGLGKGNDMLSICAIELKREWMRGEISDAQMDATYNLLETFTGFSEKSGARLAVCYATCRETLDSAFNAAFSAALFAESLCPKKTLQEKLFDYGNVLISTISDLTDVLCLLLKEASK